MNLTDYPTPRTEENGWDISDLENGVIPCFDGDWVPSHVSRQLEREAAAWRAVATRLADTIWPDNDERANSLEAFDALKFQLNETKP